MSDTRSYLVQAYDHRILIYSASYDVTAADEARLYCERDLAGVHDHTAIHVQCDQCGEFSPTTQDRSDGQAECYPCWQSSLEHGHIHGLHDDSDDQYTEDGQHISVPDCPLCPSLPRCTYCLTTGHVAADCPEQ